MKIIEAMKRIKANKKKIQELQLLIKDNSARFAHETPKYENTEDKVREWTQSAQDTVQENIRLLTAIARTNLQTKVSIELGGRMVQKTIAEWVWRRREYAAVDQLTWELQTDRGLKEGMMPNTSTGVAFEVKLVRNYSPEARDEALMMYRGEAAAIDAALEVTNAVTDLDEGPVRLPAGL